MEIMRFMVYQMDVKSAFLYETIKEEVYFCKPPGFEDPDRPDKVYKVVRVLYGLNQAPRAWKHFKTLILDESRIPDFDLFSDQEEYSEEEVAKTMAETMEQYMSKTRSDYGSGVSRPKIEDQDNFELKG
nr:putative ribonuclease H-like domain-containing protein [Tanacetum cinerariifolium]